MVYHCILPQHFQFCVFWLWSLLLGWYFLTFCQRKQRKFLLWHQVQTVILDIILSPSITFFLLESLGWKFFILASVTDWSVWAELKTWYQCEMSLRNTRDHLKRFYGKGKLGFYCKSVGATQACKSDISVHAVPCWFISQKLSANARNKECEFLSIHCL